MTQFVFDGVTYPIQRVIGKLGKLDGKQPTVVIVAGMHGNEPTGVLALKQVVEDLQTRNVMVNGEFIALTGNTAALSQNERFLWSDLNRLWAGPFLDELNREPDEAERNGAVELRERRELFSQIKPLFSRKGPLYFIDLHTTSSETIPFIIINDQLRNRNFAKKFPVPIVLGLEEYLEGPMLSFLNDCGYTSIGFEAGQHIMRESVDTHRAFIYLALVHAGVVQARDVPQLDECRRYLIARRQTGDVALDCDPCFVEVVDRVGILEHQHFVMIDKIANFSVVKKGNALATLDGDTVYAEHDARIFMPRYMPVGTDAFFIVKSIPKWAIWASELLRRFNFDRILSWLPGIRRDKSYPETLIVNPKIARFLAVKIFHLLGYRRQKTVAGLLYFSRREIISKTPPTA
ncbi:MAG TPA: succinylglutamate desuccinylase/aspartoacylase family protein [Pirellulaceae bacterium]|nr:succinylglutamate desuccinylase/aspartoacylase family protein [Pirellulaceae bacterium]HMO94395.1 succinylglutamate desuccinylase/aspartoacylase family protein [Pirellulaceae bacterium]HMP71454.1 succinylglutamate desuccinylase/aspartoacylase family protein [Pirellulaceae bacterium]